MGNNLHVTQNSNGSWNVKGDGSTKVINLLSAQKETISRAREITNQPKLKSRNS